MNDFDLDAKLKSVPLPERPAEYWENFPTRVRWQLRRTATQPEARESWQPHFGWGFGIGFACLVVSLFMLSQPLKAATSAVIKKEMHIRQQIAALPNHFRAFILKIIVGNRITP